MINHKSVLAVIPARGGSKRFPRKNLALFHGKPLIQIAWETARGSKYIDKLLLSSEDKEILNLSRSLGINVLPRPKELAEDEALNEDVLRDALSCYQCDWVVLLQPTSPLRTSEDIDACIERAQLGYGCITYDDTTHEKNGAVYVAAREWLEKHDFSHEGLMKLRMPHERSLDINYESDLCE